MKEYIKNILKVEKILSEKNGVIYFSVPPGDIKPSKDGNPQDQSKWSYWRKSNYDFFVEELNKSPHEKILADVGAGQLEFKEITGKFRVCNVDFYSYPGIDVVCDFGAGLPFRDESVDIILLSNVLEHIPEPQKLLEECFRVLKKNGYVLGSVPFLIPIHQKPYDFFRYTDVNLKYIFNKSGFTSVSIKPVLMMHVLLFGMSAHFFTDLINKTKFSDNKFLQFVSKYFLKIIWKIVRTGFFVLGPLFGKSLQNPDFPHGYLFRAAKV